MSNKYSLCCGLLAALFASTVTNAQYEIPWHTGDGGGTMFSTGGTFSLGGTIGQPDAQPATNMTGGAFELTGGFWSTADVCFCLGDLNHDGQKNGADVKKFSECLLVDGNCSCADIDQVDGVTIDDIAPFVEDLLSGPDCP